MPAHRTTPEQFWSKVAKSADPDACWLWQGTIGEQGYGVLSYQNVRRRAHCVAFELAYEPIPAGIFVCHSCDVRACCNPAHLWLGTPAANIEDKMLKGRHRWNTQRGEDRSAAKLTEDDVRAIRNRYAAGGILYRELAEAYGVHPVTIGGIVRGQLWAHVEGIRPLLPKGTGARNARALITEETVRTIRTRYAAGGTTLTKLAVEYGLGVSTIHGIVQRLSWRHVT